MPSAWEAISLLLGFVSSVLFAFARSREKETDRRFREVSEAAKKDVAAKSRDAERRLESLERAKESGADEAKKLTESLHEAAMHRMKQETEIQLLKQSHEGMATDVDEIKRNMVTRDMWAATTNQINASFRELLGAFQMRPGTGRYTATPQPQSNPPSAYDPNKKPRWLPTIAPKDPRRGCSSPAGALRRSGTALRLGGSRNPP